MLGNDHTLSYFTLMSLLVNKYRLLRIECHLPETVMSIKNTIMENR